MCLNVTFIASHISVKRAACQTRFVNVPTLIWLSPGKWREARGDGQRTSMIQDSSPLPLLPIAYCPLPLTCSNFFDGGRGQFKIRHPGVTVDLDSHEVLHRWLIKVLGEETDTLHHRQVGLHT